MKYGNLFFGMVEERRDIVPKLCLQEYKIQLFLCTVKKKTVVELITKFICGKLRPDRLYIKLVCITYLITHNLSFRVL